MDNDRDVSCDTVPLTYEELADRLGIDIQSARRRALRSHWTKSKGNDGRARVHVPVTVLPAATATDPATNATVSPAVAVTPEVMSHLLSEIGKLAELSRVNLENALSRTERAEAMADQERAARHVEQERAASLTRELADAHAMLARRESELASVREALNRADRFVIDYNPKVIDANKRADLERTRGDDLKVDRDAARGELIALTAGGPMARAWRAFWRGRT